MSRDHLPVTVANPDVVRLADNQLLPVRGWHIEVDQRIVCCHAYSPNSFAACGATLVRISQSQAAPSARQPHLESLVFALVIAIITVARRPAENGLNDAPLTWCHSWSKRLELVSTSFASVDGITAPPSASSRRDPQSRRPSRPESAACR